MRAEGRSLRAIAVALKVKKSTIVRAFATARVVDPGGLEQADGAC
jgi:hypothetical protein